MKRNQLGTTGIWVTELAFGAAPIGNLYAPLPDDDAEAAVRAAWECGVRYFDTAPHYGLGLSERRLGAVLREYPRAEYAVSTKVGRLLRPNPEPTGSDLCSGGFAVPDEWVRERDYSRDGVRRSLDASLERLGLDRVDVVYVHDPEDHLEQAVREAVPALAELREQGLVGAVGVGMNVVMPLLRVVVEAEVDVVMLAGRWSLADRSGAPLLEACAAHGVSVAAAAPFNSGLLLGPAEDAYFDYAPAPPDVLAFAARLAAACAEHGTTLPHAAVQFPLRHPAVATVVAGMRTADQARADADWASVPVREPVWASLAALDPVRPRRLGAEFSEKGAPRAGSGRRHDHRTT